MVSEYPPGGTSGVKEPIKGRKMTLWNRAEGTIDLERNEGNWIMEGKASSHPGKGKEIVDDSNPEEEHSPSPAIRTQMVLSVKEFPHFEGMGREDVITSIRRVDEIAQGAFWMHKEWVLTVVDLLGGRAAPLASVETSVQTFLYWRMDQSEGQQLLSWCVDQWLMPVSAIKVEVF